MKTVDMPACKCLACGMPINNASGPNEEGPEEGDLSICFKCGHLMIFTSDLQVRELNSYERKRAARDDELLALQEARAKIINGYS